MEDLGRKGDKNAKKQLFFYFYQFFYAVMQ